MREAASQNETEEIVVTVWGIGSVVGREVCTFCCFMMDSSGLAWYRLGAWQLMGTRGARRGTDAPVRERRKRIQSNSKYC
jgi:hypothetical protein